MNDQMMHKGNQSIRHPFGLAIVMLGLLFTSCEDQLGSQPGGDELTQDQMVSGLKEALKTGTKRAVDTLNQPGGYLKDEAVKIVFPPEASNVASKLRSVGAGALVDRVVKKMNRGAEDAAEKATPIFVDAVANIQFQDARSILEGTDTAATNFFRKNTRSDLFTAFKPDIKNSLEEVGAQQAWSNLTSRYNQIPLTDDIQTNLATYTTNRALDGLFVKLKKEEKRVREDPKARTKDILETVFSEFEN